ncbi:MAG: hypothetical protein ACP5GY_02715 [Vulcanisaeta sp.]
MRNNGSAKLLITATVLNALDLLTSYVGFAAFGLDELNYFATAMHLSNYVASTLSFLTYETLILALYLLSLRYNAFRIFLVVFMVAKSVVVIGNVTAYLGIDSINQGIIMLNQLLLSALNT